MAKTKKYYRRKYNKGRWSANIDNIIEDIVFQAGTSGYSLVTLQRNPVQSSSSVSQQYTVKNIELTYEFEVSDPQSLSAIENLQAYIMYVPQAMTIDETLPFTHPEYIMAYRWLGSPNLDTTQPGRSPLYIKTRLSRRLQTGDKIIFLIIGKNTSASQIISSIRGLVRYWTKAN